jgi:hypothetical protein
LGLMTPTTDVLSLIIPEVGQSLDKTEGDRASFFSLHLPGPVPISM